ncbi:bZIP transcription factor 27-like [Tasmannia lanceolata]|uniref:bZIP transcription factor 27-like n=1 Tax=Tasmannia lanceolata TaxID=3420 RepID=UPI0040633ABD
MEEVWKDMSLNSLQDKPNRENNSPKNTFRRTILQEFLPRPFKESPDLDISLFPSPTSPPATSLSLNSSPDFQYLDSTGIHQYANSLPLKSQCFSANADISTLSNSPFDAIGSSLGLSSLCKKRVPESENNSTDQRYKRMIKNRESAARSRARRQAYTNELELEVAHLREENAKLRKQQQKLCSAASAQPPTKQRLYRTSTAPL